jgi:hypothetical protein
LHAWVPPVRVGSGVHWGARCLVCVFARPLWRPCGPTKNKDGNFGPCPPPPSPHPHPPTVRLGPTLQEDTVLVKVVREQLAALGTDDDDLISPMGWKDISNHLPDRSGKQCRERCVGAARHAARGTSHPPACGCTGCRVETPSPPGGAQGL